MAKEATNHSAELAPLFSERFVECVGDLHRLAGKRAGSYALLGDLSKRGLESSQDLSLEHAVDIGTVEGLAEVSAYISIEQNRVCYTEGVLAVAAQGNIDIKADIVVNHAEWDRVHSTVAVAHDFLDVYIVNALVMALPDRRR